MREQAVMSSVNYSKFPCEKQHNGRYMNPPRGLILGHMPFIGVSYQSRARDSEYNKIFSRENSIKRVIEAAVEIGIHRFASATEHASPLSSLHLEALQSVIEAGHNIEVIPCIGIPLRLGNTEIDPYRRWATYVHIEAQLYPEAKQRMIHDPIMNFRENWQSRLTSSKPYDEGQLHKLTINWEIVDEDLQFFMQLPVNHIEFGSETDLLAMAGRFDLLEELIDHARSRGFNQVSFGLHHAGLTIPLLDEQLQDVGYVTPLNPLGVMMFPTKPSVEEAVRNAKGAVVAIKPLAGGRVKPPQAFNYLVNVPVEEFMVGVGSVSELRQNVKAASEVFPRVN